MLDSYTNTSPPLNSSSFPGGTVCKRCNSASLYTKVQGPHVALICGDCGLWQRWVSRSDARHYQRDKVQISEPPKVHLSELSKITPPVADTPDLDLSARVEKLEQAFAAYDTQLAILVRAVLSAGVLQGKGAAPARVNVNDELVDKFVREVADE